MHLLTGMFALFCAWKWGDWRNWAKYEKTLLFVVAGNLLYNFVYFDHWLWQMKPEVFADSILVELFYTFLVFPATCLLFLSNYPKPMGRQIIHNLEFIAVYVAFEVAFLYSGRILYDNGWNIWWSVGWNLMMFPMWILHYRCSIAAYALSLVVVGAVVLRFPINAL